ncbi:MAG TPA: YggT family protein [Thermoanaerobaculia bacterium]|nr:YggT family protein [Thermoanaerobaculia bacterium]
MTVGNAFLRTLLLTLNFIFEIIWWFILVWVILSWILFFASQTSFRWKYRSFYNILALLNDFFTRATNPLLRPFRRLLPPWKTGGIDWSPLLLLLAIYFIRTFLNMAFAPLLFQ